MAENSSIPTLPASFVGSANGVYAFLLNVEQAEHGTKLLNVHHIEGRSIKNSFYFSFDFGQKLVPHLPEKLSRLLLVGNFDDRVDFNVVVATISNSRSVISIAEGGMSKTAGR